MQVIYPCFYCKSMTPELSETTGDYETGCKKNLKLGNTSCSGFIKINKDEKEELKRKMMARKKPNIGIIVYPEFELKEEKRVVYPAFRNTRIMKDEKGYYIRINYNYMLESATYGKMAYSARNYRPEKGLKGYLSNEKVIRQQIDAGREIFYSRPNIAFKIIEHRALSVVVEPIAFSFKLK